MNRKFSKNTALSATTGGIAEITTRRPTITKIPKGFERGFALAPPAEAEFFPPPLPRQRDAITGLARSTLLEVAERCGALVRIRKPGAVRGKLLIRRAVLLDHLNSLAKGGPGHE